MKKIIFGLIAGLLIIVFICNIFYTRQNLSLIIQTTAAQPKIELITIANGFNNALDIQYMGDGRLFIVQQRGLIRILDANGNIKPEPFFRHNRQSKSIRMGNGFIGTCIS